MNPLASQIEKLPEPSIRPRPGQPSSGGSWTPAGVCLVIGAISSTVISPILAAYLSSHKPPDLSNYVERRELAAAQADIAAARAACGSALAAATGAESQAKAAVEVADSATKRKKAK